MVQQTAAELSGPALYTVERSPSTFSHVETYKDYLRQTADWLHSRYEYETAPIGWKAADSWDSVKTAIYYRNLTDAFSYTKNQLIINHTTTASSTTLYLNYEYDQAWRITYELPRTTRRRVQAMQKNHRGILIRSHNSQALFSTCSPAEITALQLLRKMVETEEFRRYLRHGHVNVRGGISGLVYQIRRSERIKVWDRGELVAELCVHLHHSSMAPPTDHVIGKMLMVECDEPSVWSRSNVTWCTDKRNRRTLELVGRAA